MSNNHRRSFLRNVTGVASSILLAQGSLRGRLFAAPAADANSKETVLIEPASGGELQDVLLAHTGKSLSVRLRRPATLSCTVREDTIEGEKSIHGLIVPRGTELDLNGSTLELDLRSNSYGVRLSSDSAIRNGTIRVVRSESKGSQSCWHSGISVGAAYGDGGTAQKPGHFSQVANWSMENITIDQRFTAAAIQLMSEACHGTIRNIQVLDSQQALLGIGLDWGGVGPMTSEDAQMPRMRELWERGEIYSTHPHDIVIENIRIGKLLRNVDANNAGVRCSACHRITIRNVEVDTAATAVAIFGGDCGYEFAAARQRDEAHQGYVVEGVRIARALRFGLVLNGSSDNVWRATRAHGYEPLRDPVHPGIDQPVFRDMDLQGTNAANSQGVYAVSVRRATLEKLNIRGFAIGVHVEDWVQGMEFRQCQVRGNQRNTLVEGATEPATDVTFTPPPVR